MLQAKLDSFVAGCQELINKNYESFNSPHMVADILEQGGGVKFRRIESVRQHLVDGVGEPAGGKSAYCFVALVDGMNKKMGAFQKGDVFKCDGWKAPAKHARGNVFDDDNGLKFMSAYGPFYLN